MTTLSLIGLLLSGLICSLAVVSSGWRISWLSESGDYATIISSAAIGLLWQSKSSQDGFSQVRQEAGWSIDRFYSDMDYAVLPKAGTNPPMQYVSIPLWMPFLISAALSCYLWLRRRRFHSKKMHTATAPLLGFLALSSMGLILSIGVIIYQASGPVTLYQNGNLENTVLDYDFDHYEYLHNHKVTQSQGRSSNLGIESGLYFVLLAGLGSLDFRLVKIAGEQFFVGDGFRVPIWLLILIFAAPYCHLVPYCRRRKRKKLGLCVSCGYDLRGSSGRCPECNTPIETR